MFRKKTKLAGIVAGMTLAASLFVGGVAGAQGMTLADLVNMFISLGIITADKADAARQAAGISSVKPSTSGYNFAKDLTVGSKGADVTALQNLLGVSPATGYFGSITKAAVIQYQLAKGITPAAGYVGAKTRAVLNSAVVSGSTATTTTTVTPTGTDLRVSLAVTSPSSGAIVAGQAAANLVEFTFTNTSATAAVVTNVTLARGGVSADNALSSVYLFDGAARLTDAATVSSGKITFNSAAGLFTVPAGASKTISVKADVAQASNGQLIFISLLDIKATGASVSASYPISGSSMNIFVSNDMSAASSKLVPALGSSIIAGSVNQTIWATNLTLSGKAVYIKGLSLKVIGSVPSDALRNFKLFSSGIQIASANGVDSNGVVLFDLSSNQYKIDSSRTIEVTADVVGGSSRTFTVSLQNMSDLQLIDSNYGIGISATADGSQTTGVFTVSSGSVTVSLDPSFTATDIVTGSTNVTLGKYIVKAYGEDIKISDLAVLSSSKIEDVSISINGIKTGNTQSISSTSTPKMFTNLGISISAGSSATIEIKGAAKFDGVGSTVGDSIKVTLVGVDNNTRGVYSYTYSKTPAVDMSAPSMNVVAAGVVLAKNASVSNSSTVANKSAVKIGSYVIQTNSSESVKITSVSVEVGGTAAAATTMSNLTVKLDGNSVTQPNIQSTNKFAFSTTIPENSSRTVDVYADISNASGFASTSIAISGYGLSSNTIISSAKVVGQSVVIGSGSLAAPTVANSSPVSQFVIGSSKIKIVDLSFISNGGDSSISEMTFDVVGPITEVTVGGKTSSVLLGTVTVRGLNINIPIGYGGTIVPVVATYAKIGLNEEASMKDASVSISGFKYTSGVETITATSSVSSNTMKVVASRPSVSLLAPAETSVLSGGTKIIARVSVSSDANGIIALSSLPIKVSTTAGSSALNIGSVGQVMVGNTIVETTGGISSVGTSSVATGTINFTNDYRIDPNSSVVFDIYGTVTLAKDDSIQTSIPSSSLFAWKDVSGNATSTGSLIYNFPTNSVSVNYNVR